MAGVHELDEEAEYAFLLDAFLNKKSGTRIPQYVSEAWEKGEDDDRCAKLYHVIQFCHRFKRCINTAMGTVCLINCAAKLLAPCGVVNADMTVNCHPVFDWRRIKSGTRIPQYVSEAWEKGENDIGDTYIEVDMGNQHMYYYVDGEMVLDTPVVTGNTNS